MSEKSVNNKFSKNKIGTHSSHRRWCIGFKMCSTRSCKWKRSNSRIKKREKIMWTTFTCAFDTLFFRCFKLLSFVMLWANRSTNEGRIHKDYLLFFLSLSFFLAVCCWLLLNLFLCVLNDFHCNELDLRATNADVPLVVFILLFFVM